MASSLRLRIVDGSLRDGDLLPKQEDLLEQFRVSKPSLREALRILETEGLITVQRGNVGGARVRAPRARDAAYMIGLILQSRAVSIDEVGAALHRLEPICAGLCAARPDRATAVVPALREIHAASVNAPGDDLDFVEYSQEFHQALVTLCGNQTLIVVVGALESLWSARERAWAGRARRQHAFPPPEARRDALKSHVRLIALIADGDVEATVRFAQRHLEANQRYTTAEPGQPIQFSFVERWSEDGAGLRTARRRAGGGA